MFDIFEFLPTALGLFIVNVIITAIAVSKSKSGMSPFAIFAVVDASIAIFFGVLAVGLYAAEQSLVSAVLLVMYLTYILIPAAVMFVIALILHFVTKEKKPKE